MEHGGSSLTEVRGPPPSPSRGGVTWQPEFAASATNVARRDEPWCVPLLSGHCRHGLSSVGPQPHREAGTDGEERHVDVELMREP